MCQAAELFCFCQECYKNDNRKMCNIYKKKECIIVKMYRIMMNGAYFAQILLTKGEDRIII